jgi:hypothetical protein
MKRCHILLLAIAIGAGCQDRTTRSTDPVPGTVVADVGFVEGDVAFDEPVRALCVPGSLRCLAENSPLYARCSEDGEGSTSGACDDGQVCREGTCVPFTCVPDRPLCIGPSTRGVCDESGTTVRDVEQCEAATVCRGGACTDPCEEARSTRSYIGCEYVAQPLPNLYRELPASSDAPYAIVVANPASLVGARVTVTTDSGEPAELREPFDLVPRQRYAFAETTALRSELLLEDGSSKAIEDAEDLNVPPGAAAVLLVTDSKSYRIESSRPVVAYQFSPYCCNFTATNDASLLLPTSTWGRRYRVLGYPSWKGAAGEAFQRAYLSIVANSATSVTVDAPVALNRRGVVESSDTFELELAAGETVILEANVTDEDRSAPEVDVTGTLVESDQPVGVFTGHPCTFVPQDQWACDHLEEALLPVETWGRRYLLNPLRRRSLDPDREVREATYWRIVADEETAIRFDPPLDDLELLPPSNESSRDCAEAFDGESLVLGAGEFCEFGSTSPISLEADAAVMVGGVLSGHQSTGVSVYGTQAGDPSLFILPPVEQFRSDYAFVTPPTFKRTYVTVAARPSSPVTIDDRAIPESERLERRSVNLGNEAWEIFTIAIEPGVHAMESESRFGIVVYAYDDYVSYAFIGGLDLLPKGAGTP